MISISCRHAELVSASIAQQARTSLADGWTLKQVQGDGDFVAVEVQKLMGIALKRNVG